MAEVIEELIEGASNKRFWRLWQEARREEFNDILIPWRIHEDFEEVTQKAADKKTLTEITLAYTFFEGTARARFHVDFGWKPRAYLRYPQAAYLVTSHTNKGILGFHANIITKEDLGFLSARRNNYANYIRGMCQEMAEQYQVEVKLHFVKEE